jgi:hypothetical protein
MARKQRAEQWAEYRRQREEEERRQRVMVITEFGAGDPEATMHAMAAAILKYRRALQTLGRAAGPALELRPLFEQFVSEREADGV